MTEIEKFQLELEIELDAYFYGVVEEINAPVKFQGHKVSFRYDKDKMALAIVTNIEFNIEGGNDLILIGTHYIPDVKKIGKECFNALKSAITKEVNV